MFIGGHAGVNAAVLRHQVADLQGELPRVTVDAGSPDHNLLFHLLVLFIPVPVLPHYKHMSAQISLTHLEECPPQQSSTQVQPSLCQD